ncbi:MAG: 2-hydroxyacid dehydrogenase [Pseudomonadota bacterium]|nr:2-hydroxyacid dehydrogenase [Pseudomonadota bacterium]
MKPDILILMPLIERWHDELAEEFTIHFVRPGEDWEPVLKTAGDRIRAVVTNGTTGIDDDAIDALPNLEIIASFSAGYEGVDLDAARARNVSVTHGPGVNAASAADHAMGLLLAIQRGIVRRDKGLRNGAWGETRWLSPTITGKSLGILGLGAVGSEIAKRAAGFDMTIAYHNRRPRAGSSYHYADSPAALAEKSNYLIACCPGDESTRHIIDAEVLRALGPEGYVVNIARGSVVDTVALIAALNIGVIAGAALDVFENEPEIPKGLFEVDNVVLSPHVAGFTPEAFRGGFELVRDNLRAHFTGNPLPTPVP